jgi:hypothetical protein
MNLSLIPLWFDIGKIPAPQVLLLILEEKILSIELSHPHGFNPSIGLGFKQKLSIPLDT